MVNYPAGKEKVKKESWGWGEQGMCEGMWEGERVCHRPFNTGERAPGCCAGRLGAEDLSQF